MLNTSINDIPIAIKKFNEKLKDIQKRLKSIEQKNNEKLMHDLKNKFEVVNDLNLLIYRIDNTNLSSLRGSIDSLKGSIDKAVVVLAGDFNGKVMISISISSDISDTLDARNLLESCFQIVGAKGGGRADFIQAGGDNIEKIDEALQAVRNFFNN